MVKISFYLDKRKKLVDDSYAVRLRVAIKDKGYFLIPTGVTVKSDNWLNGRIIGTRLKDAQNALLANVHTKVYDRLVELEVAGELESMTYDELKNTISSNIRRKDTSQTELVKSQFESFISRSKKKSTAEIYTSTLNKLSKYYDIDNLRFDHITISWLKEFESYLSKDGLSVNAISIHLRNIRAIYNDAIDYEIASLANYPFRRFKIAHEKTAKRALSVEQLRELRDYPCEPHQVKYRDLFMLIFYLGGINIGDLLNLKAINNGRIEYRRAKTSALYSIKVEPEALAIIDKYKGTKYLINPLDRYADYKDFMRRMNRALQQIGEYKMVENAAKNKKDVKTNKKERTAQFPGLTTYWARHTVATLMAQLDIPKDTIAKVLGHADNDVTSIYIKFDHKKIDEAMRKVIDYVNKSEA